MRNAIHEFERCCNVIIEMLDKVEHLSNVDRLSIETALTRLTSALVRADRAR